MQRLEPWLPISNLACVSKHFFSLIKDFRLPVVNYKDYVPSKLLTVIALDNAERQLGCGTGFP